MNDDDGSFLPLPSVLVDQSARITSAAPSIEALSTRIASQSKLVSIALSESSVPRNWPVACADDDREVRHGRAHAMCGRRSAGGTLPPGQPRPSWGRCRPHWRTVIVGGGCEGKRIGYAVTPSGFHFKLVSPGTVRPLRRWDFLTIELASNGHTRPAECGVVRL